MTDAPQRDLRAELDNLRRALKETVINLESVVEEAERVLKRARQRLDELPPEDDDELSEDAQT